MGKTNKCNIQEDEILANEVQKYPCLYNKADKGYMERDRKANAWRKVDEELGFEERMAEKRFASLRKRYKKKKNTLKEKSVSGKGLEDVAKLKQELKDYRFLEWLDVHQKSRKTSTNLFRSIITRFPTVIHTESGNLRKWELVLVVNIHPRK